MASQPPWQAYTKVAQYLVDKKLQELDFNATDSSPQTVSWKDLLSRFRPATRACQLPLNVPNGYRVAIIGAGVTGLHTAMLLQSMGPFILGELQ